MTPHPHRPVHERDPATGMALGGGMPLRWKLPLLMAALLVAGLGTMLAFTYTTLAQRAALIVSGRLESASAEVAGTAARSLEQHAAGMRQVARDPAVLRVLASARPGIPPQASDLAAARAALARLRATGDPHLPVELWNAERRVVASAGRALPRTQRHGLPDLARQGAGDSVRYGPLHEAGGRVRFWSVAPVVLDGRRMGYVARLVHVGGPADATQTLRDLLGEEVRMYTRNADGRFWASAAGEPAPVPPRADSAEEGVWYERGGDRVLAGEAAIAGTPWVLVLETPESWILSRPRSTTRRLAFIGLLITAVGVALAGLAGRRMARPLLALAGAAESLALGSYARPVAGGGSDEIGRLAARFDAMARQVAAARSELEGRVDEAQRARGEAEQARAEAELANRAKSDFLAVMSHELRTPLNAIGGYAQLLEMGIHGPVTEAQRDALLRIERSQAHLLTLINDVLNFARIDAGQVQYAMADVPAADALAEVETLLAPQAQSAGLRLRVLPCAPDTRVRADRDKLRQVLINLLGNAIKYTPPGGSVSVECEACGDRVRLHVRDTGTGIRPERLAHIFEPFVQGERALNRPDEGVGLGLAISRELARGMGGELEVESEVDRGSVFTVVLDRAAPALSGITLWRENESAAT